MSARMAVAGPMTLVFIAFVCFPRHGSAATLRPETEEAWRRYVLAIEQRIDGQLAAAQDNARSEGPLGITPAGGDGNDATVPVASGLIHHWRGRVFIPGATVDDLVERSRSGSPIRHQRDVRSWRILERTDDTVRLFLKLEKSHLITVHYNTEHVVRYRRHGAALASSRSVATKIAELENPGTPDEREKVPGDDLGLLWRLNSYWRYEAVRGGVLVECESISLSRSVPAALGPFVRGSIERIARESLAQTLEALRISIKESTESTNQGTRNQGTRN
jgi:hypothetical protein